MEQDIREEQLYAQLWKLDLQKKEARERQEAIDKKERVNDTKAVLDW